MKQTRIAFAALFTLGFALSADAREGSTIFVSQNAHVGEQSNLEASGAQNEIAENLPRCRKVDVDLDEGYGVTGHATRDECPPRRR